MVHKFAGTILVDMTAEMGGAHLGGRCGGTAPALPRPYGGPPACACTCLCVASRARARGGGRLSPPLRAHHSLHPPFPATHHPPRHQRPAPLHAGAGARRAWPPLNRSLHALNAPITPFGTPPHPQGTNDQRLYMLKLERKTAADDYMLALDHKCAFEHFLNSARAVQALVGLNSPRDGRQLPSPRRSPSWRRLLMPPGWKQRSTRAAARSRLWPRGITTRAPSPHSHPAIPRGRITYITSMLAASLGHQPEAMAGQDISKYLAQPSNQLHPLWWKVGGWPPTL